MSDKLITLENLELYTKDFIAKNIAPEYSSSSTYHIDELCVYNNILHKCITDITTAEQWNPDHWSAMPLSKGLKVFDGVIRTSNTYQIPNPKRPGTFIINYADISYGIMFVADTGSKYGCWFIWSRIGKETTYPEKQKPRIGIGSASYNDNYFSIPEQAQQGNILIPYDSGVTSAWNDLWNTYPVSNSSKAITSGGVYAAIWSFLYMCVAPNYNSNNTYKLGDICTHNLYVYKCTTAITTPESWNSNHWTYFSLSERLPSTIDITNMGGIESGPLDTDIFDAAIAADKLKLTDNGVTFYYTLQTQVEDAETQTTGAIFKTTLFDVANNTVSDQFIILTNVAGVRNVSVQNPVAAAINSAY